MAKKGRNDLTTTSGIKFPTNNVNLIKAKDHREYNKDIIDSKFNLIDDELKGLWYNKTNNLTLEQMLGKQTSIVAKVDILLPNALLPTTTASTGFSATISKSLNVTGVELFGKSTTIGTVSQGSMTTLYTSKVDTKIKVKGNFGVDYIVLGNPSIDGDISDYNNNEFIVNYSKIITFNNHNSNHIVTGNLRLLVLKM